MVTDYICDNTYRVTYPLPIFWDCYLNRMDLGYKK